MDHFKSPQKMTFRHLSLCIYALLSFFAAPNYLFATCDCPDPTLCAPQPNAPPYSPCTFITSANSYTVRYAVTGLKGQMTFIGNTLGLSKLRCFNEPGTPGQVIDSIGAFTTTDPTQQVGSYLSLSSGIGSPAGTTLDWRLNASSAELTMPANSTILHAELVWSGSFGYYCSNPTTGPGVGVDPNCVLNYASGPIKFTTPDGQIHLITADPVTAFESQNPALDVQNYYCAGNYTRSQDVTALMILLTSPSGTYTVGAVPATVSALDDSHNAAGWTLVVVYQDPASALINNISLFLGAQQGSRAAISIPASMTGFCAQTDPALIKARLLVSAIEGDADIQGDNMFFGPTTTLGSSNIVTGPNNLLNNFFSSQINDDNGNLISTTGTYCGFNQDPIFGVLVPNGRQGYDITNVDCSSLISSGQTAAYALGATAPGGDDYTINALGLQISVQAPTIIPIKKVNGQLSINAQIGDVVTFSITINNTGTSDALNVIFQDTIESGLQFIPGSVRYNSVPMPLADPTAGVPLNTVAINALNIIEFDVKIISYPPSGSIFINKGNATFGYQACSTTIDTSNNSNLALIVLPLDPTGPAYFNGTIKKCKFINETSYSLIATWPPVIPTAGAPAPLGYQILKNGVVIAMIPPQGPYIFKTCLTSQKSAYDYAIMAMYPPGDITPIIPIRIIK